MPRKKNQVPGQIDLLLTAPEPTTAKNKRDRKKTETTTKPKTKELEKKAKSPVKDSEPVKNTQKKNKKFALLQTDIPVKKTSRKKKKKYTQAQYRAAVKMAEECGVVNAGKLINRFHIPANMALDILTKMQEESIITEKGAVAKKKGIVWKEK